MFDYESNKLFDIGMAVNPKARQPQLIDIQLGNRLKARRKSLCLSQKQLAEYVGISFQQLQKYEAGSNRIGAGRLFQFAQALAVPVDFFYWGLKDSDFLPESRLRGQDVMQLDEAALQTAVSMTSIADKELRLALHALIEEIANTQCGSRQS